jgi:hypothetical protein
MSKKIILGVMALALGIGAGLLAGWYVWPVSYTEAAPHLLEQSWKNEAIWLIAQAFAYDRDLEAAQARLRALNAPAEAIDLGQLVLDRTELAIEQGLTRDSLTALARLAAALGARSDRTAPYLTP